MSTSRESNDVFVSYAASDRERARPLVEFLQQSGLDVWWDGRIAPGAGFDAEIQDALDKARCVLVIWSRDSIISDWVIAEASEGLERGILVPIAIDPVRPPLAFRRRQTIDVTDSKSASDDVLTAIRNVIEGRIVAVQRARPRVRRPWFWILTVVNVGVFLGIAGMLWKLLATEQPPSGDQTVRTSMQLRTNIDLSPGVTLAVTGDSFALTPDGTKLVLVGWHDGQTALYLRSIDQAETWPIAGTANAEMPFFSPDGQQIGFWANGHLQTLSLAGGGPSVICEAADAGGGTWLPDDTIVFSDGHRLRRVSSDGGDCQPITAPDASKLEYSHVLPVALPGGQAVLFEIYYNGGERSVALLSLRSRKWKVLVTGARQPRFMMPGFVVVNRGGTLEAAPFDLAHLSVSGPFTPLGEGASTARAESVESYDVAAAGRSLVYVTWIGVSPGTQRGLYSIDLHGRAALLSPDRKAYWHPSLSPDGSKLAVNVFIDKRTSEVWTFDLARKTWQRLTSGHDDWEPIWKDGQTLLFARGLTQGWEEDALPVSGNGTPKRITSFAQQILSGALAPDHRAMVVNRPGPTSRDLWVKPLALHAKARPLITTPSNERAFTQGFSPDGRWLAYNSDATGRDEVYVTDFPAGSARYRVSQAGGVFPCWSRDGRRIFYWQGNMMMAVTIKAGKTFATEGTPHALFVSPIAVFHEFDVAPDGRHFYALGYELKPMSPIVFVSDVTADLRSGASQP